MRRDPRASGRVLLPNRSRSGSLQRGASGIGQGEASGGKWRDKEIKDQASHGLKSDARAVAVCPAAERHDVQLGHPRTLACDSLVARTIVPDNGTYH